MLEARFLVPSLRSKLPLPRNAELMTLMLPVPGAAGAAGVAVAGASGAAEAVAVIVVRAVAVELSANLAVTSYSPPAAVIAALSLT
jgi:hypothetical protein